MMLSANCRLFVPRMEQSVTAPNSPIMTTRPRPNSKANAESVRKGLRGHARRVVVGDEKERAALCDPLSNRISLCDGECGSSSLLDRRGGVRTIRVRDQQHVGCRQPRSPERDDVHRDAKSNICDLRDERSKRARRGKPVVVGPVEQDTGACRRSLRAERLDAERNQHRHDDETK
jgi:hypothetical protein